MLKAYKYKIHPTAEQQQQLEMFFGCTRFIYNWGLNIKTSEYKEYGRNVSYVDLAKQLTLLKQQKEYEWLQECAAETLQQSLRCLESAFNGFFRKKAKYPVFKSKHKSRQSCKFLTCVYFDFDEWKVKLPKLGWIKLCKNRTFNQEVCKQGTCTVSKDHCGEYWCVISVETYEPKAAKAKLSMDTAVGIDLGIKDYATLSDGTKYSNPKHENSVRIKLARAQRSLSRKQKGSANREKARLEVARLHRKVANQRTDFLHKLTTDLIRKYDTICLEDLNIAGMEKNHHLARAIQGAAWGEFQRQLEYKAEWYGKNVLYIGRFTPSSKLCHKCGYINNELTLNQREWMCPQCRERLDRDVNAAINIKNVAFDAENLIDAAMNKTACGQAGAETVEGRGYEPCEAVSPRLYPVGVN